MAQTPDVPSKEFSAQVEVIARSVAIDVLDANGRSVDDVPLALLSVFEDGVHRPLLEVRAVAPRRTTGAGAIVAESRTRPMAAAEPVESHVLLALDSLTLGLREWRQATAELARAAEAMVALGPVDVAALGAPPRLAVQATRNPTEVRMALALLGMEVTPGVGFYAPRARLMREVQAMFKGGPSVPQVQTEIGLVGHDPTGHLQNLVHWARSEMLQLAQAEESVLRAALDRLREHLATVPRPVVLVWVAGGDPLPGEFIRQMLPPGASSEDKLRIIEVARSFVFWDHLDDVWKSWAQDGIRVLGWSPAELERVDLGTAESSMPSPNDLQRPLALEPLALFQAAATATGGALVQDVDRLPELLASVGGRFVATYQTAGSAAGWRSLRVEVARPGWTVRYPPRILIAEQPATAVEGPAPIMLAVELDAVSRPSDQPGREVVKLPVAIDLAALRERLGPEGKAQFTLRLYAVPPGGKVASRELDLQVPQVPSEGVLRYEASLVVPVGTRAFAIEVRETISGAMGFAGPVEAIPAEVAGALQGEGAQPGVTASTGVHIAEARFLVPEDTVVVPEQVRVVWEGHDQRLVRVVGGPGSSLEIGIAFDVSESVRKERQAFARAATEAAGRLLAADDRVFRVDFDNTPRFIGSFLGGSGALFAEQPPGQPAKTAIFDGLRFALDRFAGNADRAALIVFTDGCETARRTTWREVERVARGRAIPVFVVLADGHACGDVIPLLPPVSSGIASVQTVGRGQTIDVSTVSAGSDALGSLDEGSMDSRSMLRRIAKDTGGMVFPLRRAEKAPDVWADIEAALARLFVAVFDPSDPRLQPRQVEVRLGKDRLLRPSE